ncbi:hypothetical protein V1507DRAFT_463650 [Lipomyces tetrasporus]
MQANIADAFKNARQTPDYKRRCLSRGATRELDPDLVEQLYVRWIQSVASHFAWLHYQNLGPYFII